MDSKEVKKISSGKKLYILTLICTLIALSLIVSVTFFSFYFVARNDAVSLGESSVSQQSERLNNFLLKGLDVLEATGITVEYMMKNGATSDEIVDFLLNQSKDYNKEMDDNFTGIYGLFNGEYLDGIGWVPEEGYEPKSRPWYQAAVEGKGQPVVVSPYLDAQTNSIMISVSQLLYDKESVISLDIVMDEMQEFSEQINLNGKGYGFIVDNTGLIVAHSDSNEKGKNYISDSDVKDTTMHKMISSVLEGDGKTVTLDIDGEESRIFSEVVQDRWYVVMVVNVHDLFEKVESTLIISLILSLLIYIVLAFFITTSYKNRTKAVHYAEELKEYQETLEERVKEQTDRIRNQADRMIELEKNAVESMATLIESRDGNTGEHVQNTKKYVSMILEYMYDNELHKDVVTESYVRKATYAAALHDVGKIKISDTILNKPGRFTPEEYEIMKQHAPYGGDIVKDILGKNADKELLAIARDVTRYHHEKWDGSGYPHGLKEKDIPLCARIMAVADVFDALVSKRVYKDAMTMDKAIEILKQDAGSHFDPEIVDIFLKIAPKVEEHLRAVNKVALGGA